MMQLYLKEGLFTSLLTISILYTRNIYFVAGTYLLLLMLGDKEYMGFINPAITFAMSVAGVISSKDVIYFWTAQFIGALFGLQIYVSMMRS
jgi:glycerol uptake facilitator-like aquaporin